MADKIKHTGIVENTDGPWLKVRIVQTSACAACSIKTHCNVAESEEKLIDVYNGRMLDCRPGQEVTVGGETSLGLKAVFWAFVCPFVVMLAALFVSMSVSGNNEPLSALVALCMLIPYYIGLYACRKRLKRTFVFTLESINN